MNHSPETSPVPEASTLAESPAPSAKSAKRRRLRRRLRETLGWVGTTLTPGPRAWRGATWGLIAMAACVWISIISQILAVPAPNWAGLFAVVWAFVGAFLAGGVFVLLLRMLTAPPRLFRWALASVLLLLALPVSAAGKLGIAILLLVAVVVPSFTGAGLFVLVRRGAPPTTAPRRRIAILGLSLGAVGVIFALGWLLREGSIEKAIPNAANAAAAKPVRLTVTDPATPGPHRVLTLTYGGGTDRHRSEFGAKAALRTQPVDGSPFIERWSGPAGWARTRYWGFDATQLPLQGRVWYPDGEGPFPLVLVVHGNHQAEDFSDYGYGYLGELLASRGFILVSVDENFLNGSAGDLLGFPEVGLKEENDARGWLLLQHLKVWREWNKTDGNPFRGKVDLQRIALIGHSRGGEAVATAAVFNRLPFCPDDARLRFDFGYAIRAVVAIAPVDGQYKPAGVPTRIENTSYFVLHGSHDGDVQSYHGARVFERVRFTDGGDHFKAGLYVHRANHGQFNTAWGRGNAGLLGDLFLNRKPLLTKEEQERIAKVYISAFLEATLRDEHDYRPLFRDHRVAQGWLPDLVYLHQYTDSSTQALANYDEDLDVTTTTLSGGRIEGQNLADWREKEIEIKWGTLDTRAVMLGWDRERDNATAAYRVILPENRPVVSPNTVLTFHLADAKREPSKPLGQQKQDQAQPKAKEKKKDADEEPQPIDLTIEVVDGAGNTARLPLSHVSALQPQIVATVVKAAFLTDVPTSEVVFQVFDFRLAEFVTANPSFDPATLRSVSLVFDRSPKGVVILDDLGFRDSSERSDR